MRGCARRDWGPWLAEGLQALVADVLMLNMSLAFVPLPAPQRLSSAACARPSLLSPAATRPGGTCLRPPEWCASSQASAQDPGPLCPLPRSSSSGSFLVGSLWLGGKNFCTDEAVALGTLLTT